MSSIFHSKDDDIKQQIGSLEDMYAQCFEDETANMILFEIHRKIKILESKLVEQTRKSSIEISRPVQTIKS